VLKTKVTTLGSSTGIVLPKEALARLKVEKGDTLNLVETPEGYNLVAHDPEFEEQMRVFERGMRRYRNALRKLAKK
jgi:putative addiction module antidote